MSKNTKVITLRVSDALAEKIAFAVGISGRDQSDILREAVEMGIDDLLLIGANPLNAAKEKINAIKSEKLEPPADCPPRMTRAANRTAKPNAANVVRG